MRGRGQPTPCCADRACSCRSNRPFLRLPLLGAPEEAHAPFNAAPTAREAARELLAGAAVAYTCEETPKGCLVASATASGSAASADVQAVVTSVRRDVEQRLRSRIERDVVEGVLPPGTDAGALAGLVMAATQGMSVLARDGVERSALLAIADTALAAWPTYSRP